MSQPQQEMTPEDQAMALEAGRAESEAMSEAMVAYLQQRVGLLALEVRRRDVRIAELEAALAQGDVAHVVSGDGSGDRPQ